MENITGVVSKRNTMEDVYFFDLGTKGAFLNMITVISLKVTRSDWPTFTYESDIKLCRGLVALTNLEEDRHKAAQAYMASLYLGESKACQIAGRWLGMAVVKGIEQERAVRGMLAGVSDDDMKIIEKLKPPPYMYETPLARELTTREATEWRLGACEQNKNLLEILNSNLLNLNGKWVVAGAGSTSLGIGDAGSDYDFLCASKEGEKDVKIPASYLSNASRSQTHSLFNTRWGQLMKMDDVETDNGALASVDISFPKEGFEAILILAHKGLFWQRLFATEAGEQIKQFFIGIRLKARRSGVVDSVGGMLNMWSFMIKGLEYLCVKGLVIYNSETPLIDQTPITDIDSFDESCSVEECLLEFSSELTDLNRVIGDFSSGTSSSQRGASEFRDSAAARIMRDPFSYCGDNVLRTLHREKVEQVIIMMEHSAFCDQIEHKKTMYSEQEDFWSSNNFVDYFGPNMNDDKDSSVNVTILGPYNIAKSTNGAYAVSMDEVDVRMRIIFNKQYDMTTFETIMGPAMVKAAKGNLTVEWVISHMNCFYFGYDKAARAYDVGMCPHDTHGSSTMHKGDISEIEMLLTKIDSVVKVNKKSKAILQQQLRDKVKGTGIKVW